MTEPERDLADIMRRLERVHGTAMAKHVRCHPFAIDRRLGSGRGDDVLGEDIFEPRPGHRTTDAAEEQRRVIAVRAGGEPCPEGDRSLLPQRQDALAPPLAHNVDAAGGRASSRSI